MAARPFINGFNDATPRLVLAVVDLLRYGTGLHHLAARTTLVLDNTLIAMFFAVFEASVETQEHDAKQLTLNPTDEKILGLHYG
jgi:hypothetical protein